jgi:protein SCO1
MRGFARTFFTFTSFAIVPIAGARSVKVDALIVSVDPGAQTITAAHRPIAGYMPAMTMPFRVRDAGELAGLTAGTRIEFELERSAEGSFARHLRKIAPADPDLVRPGLPVGAALPDFALADQSGRITKLSDLRGKLIALQFIYTRCPVAEVCPRMAAGFATLQRRFGSDAGLALLSVSLDPRYDTPSVLADYAKNWKAEPEVWRFLTGSEEAIASLAGRFGVVYWPEDGTLTHTAHTVLIGRDGRIAATIEGSSYRVDQLIELVRHHLEVSR